MKKMKVFINPGHSPNGCPDPGSVGNGLRECDIAKTCSDLVEKYLEDASVEVVGNAQSASLLEIVRVANNIEPDVFLSIHCNAFDGKAHGTEVWFFHTSRKGKLLAQCIQKQIVDTLHTTDRGIKSAEPGRSGLYVLTNTDAVAVLIELAFIDHPGDAYLLKNEIDQFARAVARGVTDYELL